MSIEEKKNETTLKTLTLENDERAKVLLGDWPKWKEAKVRLLETLAKAEQNTVAAFFGSKIQKGAAFGYQALANIRLGSAGNIRDLWLKYESAEFAAGHAPSVFDFLTKNLVALTEEELKALKEKEKHEAEVKAKADAYLEACELNEIEVTAEGVKANKKLLEKFGAEVIDKIVEILNAKNSDNANA